MFWLLMRLLKRLAKKTAKRTKTTIKNVANPKKLSKVLRRKTNPAEIFNNKRKSVGGTINKVRRVLSPKQRLKDHVKAKINLIDNLTTDANEILAQRTNAEIQTSEIVKDISMNDKILNGLTKDELNTINKHIDKEFEDIFGIKSEHDMAKAIMDDVYRYDIVSKGSYDAFMDNWREGMMDLNSEVIIGDSYEVATLEEREELMREIMESKTFESEWWQTKIAK